MGAAEAGARAAGLPPAPRPRPKVGEIKGKPFKFPPAALAPLAEGELKKWGL